MEADRRDQTKRDMIFRLIHRTRKQPINTMRAEDLAKYMEVSKVTMYRYFSSKDEILKAVISTYQDYLKNENIFSIQPSESILELYQKSFEQSLLINYYFPETFINDFRANNPPLYEEIVFAQQYRFKQLELLYQSGMEKGYFHPVNAAIFVLEDELILRRILEPSFLIQHGLILKKALLDYYDMQIRKLIQEKYLHTMDHEQVHQLIDFFSAKNAGNL
ncbi:TetR/AcrR family transcriptional regulator [Bacillus altitudinis]|uniref:TetR/AcrR family transcriptional regulator n=1 Tax=Bacillus altitudinis TaxID=293387 RepID=UPI0037C7103C